MTHHMLNSYCNKPTNESKTLVSGKALLAVQLRNKPAQYSLVRTHGMALYADIVCNKSNVNVAKWKAYLNERLIFSSFVESVHSKAVSILPDHSRQIKGLLEVALDNQFILLSITPADDQVVLAGHKPVELLKPMGLAHMLDGRCRAYLAQLLLCLLLCCFQCLLVSINSLLLLDEVLLALLIV